MQVFFILTGHALNVMRSVLHSARKKEMDARRNVSLNRGAIQRRFMVIKWIILSLIVLLNISLKHNWSVNYYININWYKVLNILVTTKSKAMKNVKKNQWELNKACKLLDILVGSCKDACVWRTRGCQCDFQCRVFNTCCSDYKEHCGKCYTIKTLEICKLNGNEYFYCRVNRSTFSNIMNTILGIIMWIYLGTKLQFCSKTKLNQPKTSNVMKPPRVCKNTISFGKICIYYHLYYY